MSRRRILILFGTRPEAIKLFPVIRALQAFPTIEVLTCATAQHRDMLDQVLGIAGIRPDHDLDIMEPGQTLDRLTARLLTGIGGVLDTDAVDRVIVQGDTATAITGALAAYYRRIPVAHVEAGLRSGNILHPWPEEVNRRMIAPIADLHFAPTETAAAALRREAITAGIHVTGNSVIDALHQTLAAVEARPALAAGWQDVAPAIDGRRLILVTTHRRENFGGGLEAIAAALLRIAADPAVVLLFPVHPNPAVGAVMERMLASQDNILRVPPFDYPSFVAALAAATLVLTDSGGVQEEAPALGKPVLVMRETTERPEGVAAGTARLVGTDADRIVAEVRRLLDDRTAYAAMAQAHNPFGDGQAAARIARIVDAGTRPLSPA